MVVVLAGGWSSGIPDRDKLSHLSSGAESRTGLVDGVGLNVPFARIYRRKAGRWATLKIPVKPLSLTDHQGCSLGKKENPAGGPGSNGEAPRPVDVTHFVCYAWRNR